MKQVFNPLVIGKYVDYYDSLIMREFDIPNLIGYKPYDFYQKVNTLALPTSKYTTAIL